MAHTSALTILLLILGDPGVVSWDDAIFSGESLLLDVNFLPKISRRLTAPGSSRMTSQPQEAINAARPLEPTVREDDQQFPSQFQDGGR